MRTVTHRKIVATGVAIAIIGGAVSICAPPATAEPAPVVITSPEEPVVRHIGYTDLDLTSKPGEKMLTARLREAITSLCDEATAENYGGHQEALFICSSRAWRQARPQIARAVQRAHEMAITGTSNVAADEVGLSLAK